MRTDIYLCTHVYHFTMTHLHFHARLASDRETTMYFFKDEVQIKDDCRGTYEDDCVDACRRSVYTETRSGFRGTKLIKKTTALNYTCGK